MKGNLVFFIFGIASCVLGIPKQAKSQTTAQWGAYHSRNMISSEKNLPSSFCVSTRENIKWSASIGSHGYATPVIYGDKVLIGANNAARRDPKHEVYIALMQKTATLIGRIQCERNPEVRRLWQITKSMLEHWEGISGF